MMSEYTAAAGQSRLFMQPHSNVCRNMTRRRRGRQASSVFTAVKTDRETEEDGDLAEEGERERERDGDCCVSAVCNWRDGCALSDEFRLQCHFGNDPGGDRDGGSGAARENLSSDMTEISCCHDDPFSIPTTTLPLLPVYQSPSVAEYRC
ncbi:hypothetical protein JOB18_004018 [Solea senegalensis]|uniref:Uncharacterized protein n=1 Tax=Solea senegalensis TaxID=28829 RepID=A0AAV6RNI8_SOLSE|nr:hypothetical protein JOB18_004018 [Solea senegalensis]